MVARPARQSSSWKRARFTAKKRRLGESRGSLFLQQDLRSTLLDTRYETRVVGAGHPLNEIHDGRWQGSGGKGCARGTNVPTWIFGWRRLSARIIRNASPRGGEGGGEEKGGCSESTEGGREGIVGTLIRIVKYWSCRPVEYLVEICRSTRCNPITRGLPFFMLSTGCRAVFDATSIGSKFLEISLDKLFIVSYRSSGYTRGINIKGQKICRG